MTTRYTVETLASGQPRPYADSRTHVRLTIEVFFAWLGDPKDERSHWKPAQGWTEEQIKGLLRQMKVGFPDDVPRDWADAKLQWLKETAPGIWEFYSTSAYTD